MSGDKESLIGLVSAVSGEAYLKVEETFGNGYVKLRISEAERRQAKHDIRSVEDIVVELLRNARDAKATRILLASSREGSVRTLTMIDDGVGIPPHMHDRVFEPRVTSKLESMVMDRWGVHGRGMALYSVSENVLSAAVASSDTHRGTAVTITADCETLPERTDQSTWPQTERDESGLVRVARGPRNIVRHVLEFACEHPDLEVYLGSPVEVLATLAALSRDTIDTADLLFADDLERLPVWQRPGAAADAAELVEVASSIGISISERTAHRILANDMPPLDTVLRLAHAEEDEPTAPATPDIYRDRKGLKIHHTDLTEFKREMTTAFDKLAERYYIHLRGEPRVKIARNGISVRFDVEKED